MNAIKKILLIVVIFIYASSLCFAQTQWRIIGAGSGDEGFLMNQSSGNAQEFTYTGHLTTQWFKITGNTTVYVPLCGDSDPLGQTLTLQQENDSTETGFRIRYVGSNEYFKVTLNVTRLATILNVERVEPFPSLYIMGGPFNHNATNWLLEDAVEMEYDTINPFVFYYRGELRYNTVGDEGGNIKFLIGRTWSDNYHPVGSANVPLLQATKIRRNGDDTKWTIPADHSGDGYYVIKVNTLDETIEVSFDPETAITPLKTNEKINVFTYHRKLFIQCDENQVSNVCVFGIGGTKLLEKSFSGHAEFSFPEGFYIVKVTNVADETVTKKVIIP